MQIGITRQDVEKRWQNGNGYISQNKFWNTIQIYGWNNIIHEIFETGLTEKACEKEIHYIKEYDSINPKFGYNISKSRFSSPVRDFISHQEDTFGDIRMTQMNIL